MSDHIKAVVEGMCAEYLNSWWCIQPKGNPDWSEYPIEAQASHLLANVISRDLGLPWRTIHRPKPRVVPVCESRYWQWRAEPDDERTEARVRADVWAPDAYEPPAHAGWFFEVKLARLHRGSTRIGGHSWPKIMWRFLTDIGRLLRCSVPNDDDSKLLGGSSVRCTFLVVVMGAEGAFDALQTCTSPGLDTTKVVGVTRPIAAVKKSIWGAVASGEKDQDGGERVRRFFHSGDEALRSVMRIDDVTFTRSELLVLDGHQVQVVAISWLQSAATQL
jgi:hypothetical protein